MNRHRSAPKAVALVQWLAIYSVGVSIHDMDAPAVALQPHRGGYLEEFALFR